jgi:hypothetical protein
MNTPSTTAVWVASGVAASVELGLGADDLLLSSGVGLGVDDEIAFLSVGVGKGLFGFGVSDDAFLLRTSVL